MKTNVLPNEEYYYFSSDYDIIKNHQKVMKIVKEYLTEKSSANASELNTMCKDISKYRNFVCKFDDYKDVTRNGTEGKRVAYGAFKHSAPVHSTQTAWSYTYEILDIGDQYYMVIDLWGWMPDTDLRKKVGELLE